MASSTVAIQQQRLTRKRLIVIGTLTAIVAAFVLFSNYGVIARYRHESTVTTLRNQLRVLRATEDSLRSVIHILETDTVELERLARERFGYIRPGEEVFIIKRNTQQ